MSLLDALCCPYCSGPLFKESYYFRCQCDHRFTSSLAPAGDPASVDGGEGNATAGPAGGSLVLRVIRHPDRREIGRQYTFSIGSE